MTEQDTQFVVHSVGSGARLDVGSLQDHMPALVILGKLYLNFLSTFPNPQNRYAVISTREY